jgi:hypothetical protein
VSKAANSLCKTTPTNLESGAIMSAQEKKFEDGSNSSRTIIIVVAIVAAIVIAGLFYFLMRATGGGVPEPRLEAAIRYGSPDFETYKSKIILDDPIADESKRPLGDTMMWLRTTARNFTGRTLTGLEVTGSVIDHQGKPVKSRAVVVIPTKQPELDNNRYIDVTVVLDGLTDTDDRANIKMEVTGFKFR